MAGAGNIGSEVGRLLASSVTLNKCLNFSKLAPYQYTRNDNSSYLIQLLRRINEIELEIKPRCLMQPITVIQYILTVITLTK